VNRHLLHRVLGLLLFCALTIEAQTITNASAPQRIVLNLTANPATSMAVTWRTDAFVPDAVVQVAVASDWTDFQKNAVNVTSVSSKVSVDSGNVAYYHSAVLTGLRANTIYAYRVGGGKIWSEWNQFTTACDTAAPFEFVFFGDPQNGNTTVVPRVLRESIQKAPLARFWLLTGDITELGQYDWSWREWFAAMGFLPSMIPSIMAPGSHEYAFKSGDSVRWDVFTPLWNAQFTFPGNGPEGLEGRAYTIDYQGVRFIILDAQMGLAEQTPWLEKVLADNPDKWTVAAFHEPVYSVAAGRDGHATRNAFMALFDKYHVDLVLTGHDHVYSRSHKLKNGEVVADSESGTVYVTSLCGEKSYKPNFHYKDLMEKIQGNLQLFQVISFNGNRLTYTSFTATGRVYDSFELTK
jgi:phosphodiesterase/alkaline phosphatase D-like protein